MSLGGWQQVYSPRYMGKSTEADGANCAPRIGAKTASLAVSVCQHHLGRTVLCAHTDPLLIQRAHTLIQARIYKYEGQKSNPHICSRRKYAWYEHTHIHAQPTTDSSPSVSSPCASFSALVSLFHTLPVPRLAPSHSLIMSRWMDFQHAYSTAQHTVSHTPGGIDSWYIFYTVAYCIWLQCVNTWQVFFPDYFNKTDKTESTEALASFLITESLARVQMRSETSQVHCVIYSFIQHSVIHARTMHLKLNPIHICPVSFRPTVPHVNISLNECKLRIGYDLFFSFTNI